MINEIVSNSFKHAFPEERKGKLEIKGRRVANQEIEISVSDNGIGIPEAVDLSKIDSLGLRITTGLIDNQIGGTVNLHRKTGTRFVIRFK